MFFKVQFNSPHFIVEEKVWGGGVGRIPLEFACNTSQQFTELIKNVISNAN